MPRFYSNAEMQRETCIVFRGQTNPLLLDCEAYIPNYENCKVGLANLVTSKVCKIFLGGKRCFFEFFSTTNLDLNIKIRFPRVYCLSYNELAEIMNEKISRDSLVGNLFQVVFDSTEQRFQILVKPPVTADIIQPFTLSVNGDIARNLGFRKGMQIIESQTAPQKPDFVRDIDNVHTLTVNCNLVSSAQVNNSYERFLALVLINPAARNFHVASPILYRPVDPVIPIISTIELEIFDKEGVMVKFLGTVDCILVIQG